MRLREETASGPTEVINSEDNILKRLKRCLATCGPVLFTNDTLVPSDSSSCSLCELGSCMWSCSSCACRRVSFLSYTHQVPACPSALLHLRRIWERLNSFCLSACGSPSLILFTAPVVCAPPRSDLIIHVRDVWVRKPSVDIWDFRVAVLELRSGRSRGDGRRGRGGWRRTGRKTQQQVALWPVEVKGLGAVFTAAGLLSSLDREGGRSASGRGVRLRWTRGCRLGADSLREFNCVWDDGVATLKRMPEGGVGGFRSWRSAAGQRRGGASRGEGRHRDASPGDFRPLGQIWRFGKTKRFGSPQLMSTASWKRRG